MADKDFAHKVPQITILSDHPVKDCDGDAQTTEADRLADRDLLRLESRLGTVFDILRHQNTRCPLTLAIYGTWGTGKTSAMRWLETRLREWNKRTDTEREGHPRVYPIWFDPWRYHSKEDVWRGIISEVILALFTIGKESSIPVLPRLGQAAKKFGSFLGRAFLIALEEQEMEIEPSVLGTKLGSVKLKGKTVKAIKEEYEKTNHPEKAYLNQFEDTLRQWVHDFMPKRSDGTESARMVIFIDDLDRCLPEVTLEVLEALKLYLNIDSLVFVVGLDREVVDAVISGHYEKNKLPAAKARYYLDKLFQTSVRIPPSAPQMKGFFRDQIKALDKANTLFWSRHLDASKHREPVEAALEDLADNIPRDAKRLLNSALDRGRSAAYDKELDDSPLPTIEHRGLRFAQGMQVFMLQHYFFLRQLDPDTFLRGNVVLRWFSEASKKVQAVFDDPFAPDTDETAVCADLRQHSNLWQNASGSAQSTSPDPANPSSNPPGKITLTDLATHLKTRPGAGAEKEGDAASRWLNPLLWKILRVPFSQAVAQSAPVLEPARKTATSLEALLATTSEPLRKRIAEPLNISLDALTADHLREIKDLGLERLPLPPADLSLIGALTQLQTLDLTSTQISDLTPLSGLSQLQKLYLNNTQVSDLSPLAGLAQLQVLYLTGTQVSDLSPLAGLAQLQTLWLNNTQVSTEQVKSLQDGLLKLKEVRWTPRPTAPPNK